MNLKKFIRFLLKSSIKIISLSITLTLLIGSISIFTVLSDPANITADWENMDINIGPTGNRFALNMTFENSGYFDFDNFTIFVQFTLENKTSHENFTILNEILFQDTLTSKNQHVLHLLALESDFQTLHLLSDNGNSWNDPDVQVYIDNGTISEENASIFVYPYLLWHYDIHFSLGIQSTYFLNLITIGLQIQYLYTYDDAGFTSDYPTYKDSLLP
ncbi:MAG: hypothetical protein K9W44_11250 [Candidatus Lokiarchaeota archaeon]|nr:hypothetical protein [Candidatus Harpocratesius repetitus]